MIGYRQNPFIPLLCVVSLLIAAVAPMRAAQRPDAVLAQQSAASQEQIAQIEKLLKECDELSSKALWDDLARKAEEALKLSQEQEDKERMARALVFLGRAHFLRGQMKESLDVQKRLMLVADETGNKKIRATALNNFGVLFREQGQYEEAIDYFRKSLTINQELSDQSAELFQLRNMGVLYSEMGDFDEAAPLLQSALRLARELKNSAFEELTLTSLLIVERRRRNFSLAIKYAEQAFAIDTEVNNVGVRYELLANAATVYQDLGEHPKAIQLLRRAFELVRLSNNGLAEAFITFRIGRSQQALGSFDEALDSMVRARALLRQTGSFPDHESYFDWGIGGVQRALGHNEEALNNYRQAVNLIEQLRTSAVSTEISKASVIASRREMFADSIDLLVSLKRESEALELAEHYHARAFLDQLAQARINIQEDLTSEQRGREDGLFDRLTLIQKQLLKEGRSADHEAQLKKELGVVENDLEVFRAELRRSNPRYARTQYPELLTLDRIQKDLLDGDTVLVEYVLGEKQSFAWVVSQKKIRTAVLPPRKEIEEQVAAYRRVLAQKASALNLRQALADYDRESQKLYELLLRPLGDSLSSSRTLIIVPDGVLSYVPFEALPLAQSQPSASNQSREKQLATRDQRPTYLLERFRVSYAPSASALAAIKNRNQGPDPRRGILLAFGDPIYDTKAPTGGERSASENAPPSIASVYTERGFDFTNLPYTRAEVDAISALYPPSQRRIYLGDQAREERVKSEKLDQYRYLHFATHGMINEEVPARSGIVLSLSSDSKEDGVLQMREIMRLKLNADIVTLSACSTGLGKLQDGEGITGLTRAFLYAGADSVVVSLWNVSDPATAELMRDFYQDLKRGLPRDEALRQAKLKLLSGAQPAWRHPYFWAPFVLVGERESRSKVAP